jgi:type IV pilus assembly protein PilV
MIESLVTVVVLSFGALAFAGLQVKGLAANSSAMARSKATQLAAEMADRVRANGGVVALHTALLSSESAPPCGNDTPCNTPQAMATFDYSQWLAAVSTELPQGRAVVCLDSRPQDHLECDGAGATTVKVAWKDHDEDRYVWTSLR